MKLTGLKSSSIKGSNDYFNRQKFSAYLASSRRARPTGGIRAGFRPLKIK